MIADFRGLYYKNPENFKGKILFSKNVGVVMAPHCPYVVSSMTKVNLK